MALTPLKLFKGDPLNELVESFSGFTDLQVGAAEQATYFGSLVSVAAGASAPLPWTTLASGVDLLDRSTPDSPTFLADGLYALMLSVVAGDHFPSPLAAQVTCDVYRTPMLGSALAQSIVTLPIVGLFGAGGSAQVLLARASDGGGAIHFGLTLTAIVKLA